MILKPVSHDELHLIISFTDSDLSSSTLGVNPSITSDERKWYALYTRSRFEKKTLTELLKKNVECFLPLVKDVRIWSDRRKKVEVPLFPGYIFVKMDLRERLKALQTAGVVRFVGVHRRPSQIPEEQINWIRILVGYPEAIRTEDYLSEGQLVEIVAGPFRGVRGIVLRKRTATRVVIALESISRAVSVEVSPDFLEPAAEKSNISTVAVAV